MTTRIMVPVSGRPDADRIVPLLQKFIDHGDTAQATLVHVEPPTPASVVDFPLEYADVALADAAKRAESESFLRGIAQRIRWGTARYETVALLGDEAGSLTRFAEERSFDAIVMVSHEQSWFRRLLFGNLLDRILDAVCVPVTVLNSAMCRAAGGPGLPCCADGCHL